MTMETFEGALEVNADSLERMKQELEELKTEGRREMSERLQRAREHGDIMENAEYDAAKDAQGLMEARIRRLEEMIRRAVVREAPPSSKEAVPGMVVGIREEGQDEVEEYFLAQSPEDRLPGMRTITISSPLGAAVVGRRPGDKAQVDAPGGTFSVEVVSLRSQ